MLTKQLLFTWDENKNISNQEKHGLSFETAMHVFLDPDYIDLYDEIHFLSYSYEARGGILL